MPAFINQNFDLGENWLILLTCHEDAAGFKPMDLSDATVTFRMKRPKGGDLVVDSSTDSITILDPPTAGRCLINVAPADQTGTSPGSFPYTVRADSPTLPLVSDQLAGDVAVRGTPFPAP